MRSMWMMVGLLVLASGAHAKSGDGLALNSLHCEAPARLASRWDSRDARFGVTTQAGDVALMLGDRLLAVQLSDRALKKVRRELRDEQDDPEDNILASAIKAVVVGTVWTMLDHSIEYPIRDIRSVAYRHGRLEITAEDGNVLFEDFDVNGRSVMGDFSERDARAFVREFRRAKDRLR